MKNKGGFINEVLCPFMSTRDGNRGFQRVNCNTNCALYTGDEEQPCSWSKFLKKLTENEKNQEN